MQIPLDIIRLLKGVQKEAIKYINYSYNSAVIKSIDPETVAVWTVLQSRVSGTL